jgi:hypothetical protein
VSAEEVAMTSKKRTQAKCTVTLIVSFLAILQFAASKDSLSEEFLNPSRIEGFKNLIHNLETDILLGQTGQTIAPV